MEQLLPLGAAAQSPLASLEGVRGADHRAVVEDRLRTLATCLPDELRNPDETAMPFSGVIAFQVEGGDPIIACHSPDQTTPLSDGQSFNALSVGKLFTATSIMQLEKKFSAGLDTHLSELLTPEEMELQLERAYKDEKLSSEDLAALRQNSSKITLRHLLTHTSGLHSTDAGGEEYNPSKIGKFQYSNYGYRLLAIIIGKYSSHRNQENPNPLEDFKTHIREEIFGPAGMQGAIDEMNAPKQAPGPDRFVIDEKTSQPQKVDGSDETYAHGNGCFRMKASDLLSFGRALQQNRFKVDLKTMLTPNDKLDDSTLGFAVPFKPGQPEGYGHFGGGIGMSSFFWTWTKTTPPLTAVVLSNYSNGRDVHHILEEKLPQIFQ